MKRLAYGLVVGLAAAASVSAQAPPPGAPGQRAGGPPAPSNLQVLPKDTPREQLLQTMQAFTAALGVQCSYCHVQEGRGGRNDMASDEKPAKKTARQMMVFARELNEKLPAVVGKSASETTRVGCATCHRGVPIPKPITDIMTEAAAGGGSSAGLAKFKELRDKFYGGQSYDFGESPLITMAQRASAAQKYDDALAYLQANLDYYPKSARTYAAMAQIKNARGDKPGAVQALEKAIELDPANAQLKNQLAQLKGQ